jgi:hypothetical protein
MLAGALIGRTDDEAKVDCGALAWRALDLTNTANVIEPPFHINQPIAGRSHQRIETATIVMHRYNQRGFDIGGMNRHL